MIAFDFTLAGIGALLLGMGSFFSGLAAYRLASKAVREGEQQHEAGGTDHQRDTARGGLWIFGRRSDQRVDAEPDHHNDGEPGDG